MRNGNLEVKQRARTGARHGQQKNKTKKLNDKNNSSSSDCFADTSCCLRWPETAQAITERFPCDVDDFLPKLIEPARSAKADITDQELADAVSACVKPEQRGPGLFVKTVPEYLRYGGGTQPECNSTEQDILRMLKAAKQ